jgi:NAD(P)-dependent dehydrogenase (short-subunit alcohol dehydrogenase family)
VAKTWLITGTSSGFGRELTELLLARGDRVAATVRKPEAIYALKEKYPESLWVGTLDVTDTGNLHKIVNEAFAHFGHVDVIVSNAGYGLFGAAEEVSDAQIERQIQTNLIGSIQLARAALPHLRQQGNGHLIQISSVGGQAAFPALSLYHATKWGIEGFYESLSQEVASFGIKVTLVEPGGARTKWAGQSSDFAEPLAVYEKTPVAQIRQSLKSSAGANSKGDPRKMAQAIIDCADSANPPLRLTLGSDAYDIMKAKLSGRLAALEDQKAVALSTDVA